MSTLAVLQPSFAPWIGYFDQILKADHFVFYDDVQYDKHGWRNRNRLKALNGEPLWITVPVLHKNLDKPTINNVQIHNELPWSRKILGTITQCYRKAPFYKLYFDDLKSVLEQSWTNLSDLDIALTKWAMRQMGIGTPTYLSSELGIEGDQSGRLLALCRHFKVDHYLSGNAAQEYLDLELFQQAGVEVIWQSYNHPTYRQLNGPFVSHLSILDLLFNEGPESLRIVQGGASLPDTMQTYEGGI